ncbi:hypothetical protein M2164_006762 [Streptomyces sp. SAI-208]|uniref:DUF402 domain-containing protein n=1 Tax=unclassified Streptomyces TaxID=2593676 RepID=UPI002475B4FA|nr:MULTISPECIES: DUF402 domain-containing protein [unclassified Streptomyces]MDH6520147.1 hypothetical protein [Streptomyces sp. SAI-090]MDH6552363.1 hypothetical protein [Streptomyces sp. SAI-041]MDH6583588.1 hypothetical protein [Streptomyces sp. SAI-133]MDH6611127.1 hypothetical protein [Streptomyces sp. SAI-208]MDH6615762.1 hypothetical protein [Streptomyces sp. SAI-135]
MSANSPESPQRVDVVLLKGGRTKIRYAADLLSDDGTRVTVRAPWAGDGVRDFGFVRFEPGDVFTEHYWRDRWYSVKEVRTADGTLKGWYCDITRPAALDGAELVVEDLDLDLWVSADGKDVLRLDEDEFEESGLRERDPEAASAAMTALNDLERLARPGGAGNGATNHGRPAPDTQHCFPPL